MHQRIRTLRRLLIAAPVAVALVVVSGGTANAAVVDPAGAGISLATTIKFVDGTPTGDWLHINATGAFNSSFVANTTVALQVVGTQTWTDASGTHVAPLQDHPVSIEFANTNIVDSWLPLHTNAVVDVAYTAEVAGLAPTPFSGSCEGEGVQISDGQSTTDNDC